MPEPTEDSGAYDVVAKPAAKPTVIRAAKSIEDPIAPISPPVASPSAAGKQKLTLAYRPPKDEAPGKSDPQTLKNLYIPLWLLGGGVVVEVIAAFIREGHDVQAALTRVGAQLVVGTAVMLLGILVAAKLRRIDLGRFWVAVFKLAAISVAPSALLAIFTPFLNHIPLGGVIGWLGEFVFYFALLGMLFDLDESDTWYCVLVIFLTRVAVYFLLLSWIGS